jgi:osmotically-inducible protein OsmY
MLLVPARKKVEQERAGFESAASLSAQSRKNQLLVERVERALRATGYPALRTIDVSVQRGLVVLQGRVPSYYLKQKAQAITLSLSGVSELHNDVEVIFRSHRPQ